MASKKIVRDILYFLRFLQQHFSATMLRIRTNSCCFAEKQYTCLVLFQTFLGIPCQLEVAAGLNHHILQLPNGTEIHLPDTFLAFQPGTPISTLAQNCWLEDPYNIGVQLPVIGGTNQFEVSENRIYCGLDVLASAFFMLSRWEEQQSSVRDQHGRFPAQASLACQMGFLHRPIVHEYLELVWNMLVRLGYQGARKKRQYSILVSHDVDHPLLWWKQTDRLRTLAGSILKRGNLKETQFWLQHFQKDPFDTFDWLMMHSEQAGLVSHFNFMGDRSSNSDCYYPLQHPFVQNLIGRIEARGHVIGFHPSYESLESPDKFQQELDSLQACVKQKINTGRQHYLRFQTPDTWARWDRAGMQWDSSMGYPEMPGFRCGVCYSFPVFDVVQRKTLQLWEKPLIAMEVSLGLYQHLSPETAGAQLLQLRKTVKQYDGEFVFLWHNSSLNDYFWQSWQSVYLDLLHQP